MTIHLNGAPREMPEGSTAEDALRALGRDPSVPGVAIAVGDRVVRRAEWATTALADGDRVEVITAAQGG